MKIARSMMRARCVMARDSARRERCYARVLRYVFDADCFRHLRHADALFDA